MSGFGINITLFTCIDNYCLFIYTYIHILIIITDFNIGRNQAMLYVYFKYLKEQ